MTLTGTFRIQWKVIYILLTMTVKMAVIDRVRDTGSCGQASSTVIESETDGCNEVTLKWQNEIYLLIVTLNRDGDVVPRFTAILTSVLRRNTRSEVTIQSIGILQPCRKGNKTVNCVKLTFTNNGVTWIWVQIFNLCCGILNRSIPYALCLFCNRLEMMSKCGKNLKVA